MGNLIDEQGRINRELVGPVVTVGGHQVQPIAHVVGRAGDSWGGVRVTPTKVLVVDPQGQKQALPIFDLTSQLLRVIAGVGLVVAVVCGLIMLLRKLSRCTC